MGLALYLHKFIIFIKLQLTKKRKHVYTVRQRARDLLKSTKIVTMAPTFFFSHDHFIFVMTTLLSLRSLLIMITDSSSFVISVTLSCCPVLVKITGN